MRDVERLRRWAPGAYRADLRSRTDGGRARAAQRAATAETVDLMDLSPREGEAWFPLVAQGAVGVQGVLARVSVGGAGQALPPTVAEAVRGWVAALVGRTDTAGLQRYDLRVDNVPDGWEVQGRSLTYAAAVALISAVLGRPPRNPQVVSAALGETAGGLGAVGHLDTKRAVCALEAPGVPALLCDAPQAAPPHLTAAFGRDWRTSLFGALGVSSSRLAEEAWRSYQARALGRAETQAQAAMAAAEGQARALACWVAGACQMHRGGTEALPLLKQALAGLSAHPEARLYQHQELTAFLGIALLDNGQSEAAVTCLQAALAALDEEAGRYRMRRWQEVVVQVAGSLRRCLQACDRLDQAVDVHLRWTLGATPLLRHERTRSLMDLASTRLQAGRRDAAQATLAEARACLPDVADAARADTARYLGIQEVRAGLVEADWSVEPPDFDRWPQPLEAFETLYAAGSPHAFDAFVAAHLAAEALPPPILCQVALGAAARATLRWGPRPWTAELVAAFERAVEGGLVVDATLKAAVRALADGDAGPMARIAVY